MRARPANTTTGHDIDTVQYRPQSDPKVAGMTAPLLGSAFAVYQHLLDLRGEDREHFRRLRPQRP
jgi:hypothetical protein